MYSCVFWCEIIDLVGFFWAVIEKSDRGQTITTKSMISYQKKNTKTGIHQKVSLLYSFYGKIGKNDDI